MMSLQNNKEYGRKWTKDIENFIRAEIPVSTRPVLLQIINNIFDTSFTLNALVGFAHDNNILLCGQSQKNNGGKPRKPLNSERLSKGYIKIKTLTGWMLKNRYIYCLSHPNYHYIRGDTFIFLDGNKFNFDPKNIELLKRKEQRLFLMFGGVVPGHPDISKLHLLQARLKDAWLNVGVKIGIVKSTVRGRLDKETCRLNSKRWRTKNKDKFKTVQKRYFEKLKNNPEKYKKFQEKIKKYKRNYYLSNKKNSC